MKTNTFFTAEQHDRVRNRLEAIESAVLVWTILGLALIGFVQVISRYVFNYSFTWYEELGRYLGVFVAFLGAAIGVRTGSHFTMDLFVSALGRPWQQLLRFFTCLLSSAFFMVVVFYSWKIVTRMYGYGTTSPTIEMPMYIAYLPIPVFCLVMALRFLVVGGCELRSLRYPEENTDEDVTDNATDAEVKQ